MGDVMDLEVIFSIAGLLAMAGWLVLLASPLIPRWSDLFAGYLIPTLLSLGYVTLILIFSIKRRGRIWQSRRSYRPVCEPECDDGRVGALSGV